MQRRRKTVGVFKLINFFVPGHIDDGRLEHSTGQTQMPPSMYGHTGPIRSGSSNSSSPGGAAHGHTTTPAALLVVPQPINASKINTGLTNGSGPGRKYQCKMCPQVFINIFFFYKLNIIDYDACIPEE